MGIFTVRIVTVDGRGTTHTRDTTGLTVREAFAFMRQAHNEKAATVKQGGFPPFVKVRIDKFPQLYVFHLPS